jgi:hypothetical protein
MILVMVSILNLLNFLYHCFILCIMDNISVSRFTVILVSKGDRRVTKPFLLYSLWQWFGGCSSALEYDINEIVGLSAVFRYTCIDHWCINRQTNMFYSLKMKS